MLRLSSELIHHIADFSPSNTESLALTCRALHSDLRHRVLEDKQAALDRALTDFIGATMVAAPAFIMRLFLKYRSEKAEAFRMLRDLVTYGRGRVAPAHQFVFEFFQWKLDRIDKINGTPLPVCITLTGLATAIRMATRLSRATTQEEASSIARDHLHLMARLDTIDVVSAAYYVEGVLMVHPIKDLELDWKPMLPMVRITPVFEMDEASVRRVLFFEDKQGRPRPRDPWREGMVVYIASLMARPDQLG